MLSIPGTTSHQLSDLIKQEPTVIITPNKQLQRPSVNYLIKIKLSSYCHIYLSTCLSNVHIIYHTFFHNCLQKAVHNACMHSVIIILYYVFRHNSKDFIVYLKHHIKNGNFSLVTH